MSINIDQNKLIKENSITINGFEFNQLFLNNG